MANPKAPTFDPDIADSLRPSRDAVMQANNAAPGGAEALGESAAIDARRAMNAMKTVSAALLLSQTVPSGEQATRFQKVLDDAGALARRILLRWGVNPEDRNSRWMSNAIEKAVLPHLSSMPTDDAGLDLVAKSLADRATETPGIEVYRQERAVDLAVLRGVADLMRAQEEFDFGRKKTLDEDLAALRDLVVEASLSLMETLCPPLAPPAERATFLSLLVGQGFQQMESAWRVNATQAARALLPLNKEQQAAWRRSNPGGFSLDPVIASFRQNISRLERLTLAARKADRRRR